MVIKIDNFFYFWHKVTKKWAKISHFLPLDMQELIENHEFCTKIMIFIIFMLIFVKVMI